MSEKPYKWERRLPEWIKNNPGKGTMYKVYLDGSGEVPKQELEKQPIKITPKIKVGNPIGIYVIICEIEKYAYVGQSTNIESRLRSHKMAIVNNTSFLSSSYDLMRQHYKKHGIDAFEFRRHLYLPTKDKNLLNEKEFETMGEFARMGYRLYNKAISVQALQETIPCPLEFQEPVKKIIELLASNTRFEQELKEFLNSKL